MDIFSTFFNHHPYITATYIIAITSLVSVQICYSKGVINFISSRLPPLKKETTGKFLILFQLVFSSLTTSLYVYFFHKLTKKTDLEGLYLTIYVMIPSFVGLMVPFILDKVRDAQKETEKLKLETNKSLTPEEQKELSDIGKENSMRKFRELYE